MDRRDLGRAESTLYEQRRIRSIIDHIDILIAELTHYSMYARTLHTHAGSYRIDTVVKALHCYLRALTGDAGHSLDVDQTVYYLRHLALKEAAQECVAGTRHCDLGIIVLVIHIMYHRQHSLPLAEEIAGYRLVLREQKLILLIIHEKRLARPCLVHLARHKLTFHLLELGIDRLLLQIKDLRLKGLTQIKDGTAAEIGKEYLLRVLLSDLHIRVLVSAGIAQGYLQVRIGHLAVRDYLKILEYLHITLVRVHDHVKILVRAKHLRKHIPERLLKHTDHRSLVDILKFLKLGKTLHHVGSFLFLSHTIYIRCVYLIFVTIRNQNDRPPAGNQPLQA